ncbi:uncharacterized protein HD556DRAFT_1443423 [Suillus plorans]|uniref:Uncharacterized protein n=1 Tax=Suillus plorans TaxID=116603 RepID=A0A9P7DHG5_9AGAM|nr:uncharacterized protein HD556DRAFT_1443423 [Suillus plorans]KAG1793635.1 hypothetical protein HD556DRAFT_1443423 [Suillus plorans]
MLLQANCEKILDATATVKDTIVKSVFCCDSLNNFLAPGLATGMWGITLEGKLMPRDVATHWNSMYEMLVFTLEYQEPIDRITSDKSLKQAKRYELDDNEWKIVADLIVVLSQYKKATLFFSQDSATITAVIPAMDKLNSKLNQQTKEPYHPAVISAMHLAKNKIDCYWKITDLSNVYRIAMGRSRLLVVFCRVIVANSWKDSTLTVYQLGVNCFLAFCSANNIHSFFTLPANKFLLCAFAAFKAGSRSSSAIANNMSGIRAWHILNGVPYQEGIRLAYTIRGAHRATPSDSKRPACLPVTIDMLILLHSHLSPSNPLNAAYLAAADCTTVYLGPSSPRRVSACFSGQVLALPLPYSGKPASNIHHWSLSHALPPLVQIACEHGEDVFLGCQHAPSDPIASLDNHLSVNCLLPCSHLFAYQGPSGTLVPLTK